MRQFIQYTFASLIGSCLGLLLFVGLGASSLIALLIAATVSESEPTVNKPSVLVFDLGLQIRDADPILGGREALEEALAGEDETIALRQILLALEEAATDENIVALYLAGDPLGVDAGFATLQEVRKALKAFREAGKPIFAYDTDWSEAEYYLASAANEVTVNPLGLSVVDGLSFEPMFLKGALDRLGIGVQVVRAGKYKSAVEPFERVELSPENREQTQALLRDLWAEFITTTSEARELKPEQLQAIANSQGMVMPEEAQQRGLVDAVDHFGSVVKQLRDLTGEVEEEEDTSDLADASFRNIGIGEYARRYAQPTNRESENRIAVLYAEGEIVDGEGDFLQVGGDRFARQLRELRQDEDVKAIVLRVNSPGGSATASETIGQEVKLAAAVKPVVVSMGDLAASGGYWIATEAQEIFAEATTITGSIGVFGVLFNIQQLANDNGITWDVVKTNPYADIQSAARPKTPQEIALLQRQVDRVYEQFVTKVAKSRELPRQRVLEIAQGRVWSGQQAQEIGLVDTLGGLEQAIARAVILAKLGADWQVDEYPQEQPWGERLFGSLLESRWLGLRSAPSPDPLTAQWREFQEELKLLQGFNDPTHVYTRLPYHFKID